MTSIYRSRQGEAAVRRWCLDRLDRWQRPHERAEFTAAGARTHVVTAGSGPVTVVHVPGTNFNAAVSLPLAEALCAAGHRVVLPDVPGQPGLSSGVRGPGSGRLSWYGEWLGEVLDTVGGAGGEGAVTVMGHSFGAAIALSCPSLRAERLVLLSPGGFGRLRLTPRLLAVSAAWYVCPAPARSARLLRAMGAPGYVPRPDLVEWMTLVARHARSSGAPGLAEARRRVSYQVVTGAHDTFLPPRRLGPAVRARLGTGLDVVADAGHLLVEERPDLVAALV
ncbi:alpha/beta fold hydrolase [Streptomyces sp. NPDC059650]|uniref:alpha/beta fold hydrolase n=1 Tax=Streptomyces sp. NPDC059650 TaxID=3346896 RepID=UPI0036797D09